MTSVELKLSFSEMQEGSRYEGRGWKMEGPVANLFKGRNKESYLIMQDNRQQSRE